MSGGVNIGNEGVRAAQELRGNPNFQALVAALEVRANEAMCKSIEAPIDQRVEQTAYARALRDIWVALESAVTGVPQRAVRTPRRAAPAAAEAANETGDII